jgi:probable HAF family extracellular repeat protein
MKLLRANWRSKSSRRFAALVVLASALVFVPMGALSARAARPSGHIEYPYRLVDLGTYGGPNSFQNYPGRSLTDDGAAIGEADTAVADPNAPICFSDCTVSRGFEWRHGKRADLGALPGPNSSCPTWINERGLVAGVSEDGVDEKAGAPLDSAVLWSGHRLIPLGTLGGNQSDAGAVNNRGQVVGAALNAVSDPDPGSAGVLATTNCAIIPINTTEVRAFIWHRGVMHDLGTLGGPDAMASWINNRGQVVGQSFTSSSVNESTGYPTMDPFRWQHGTMTDLGTLGGTSGMANWLTNRGLVVGTSNLSGDQTHHAFRWEHGVMTDLGTLGGANSEAFFANDAGDVVGRADFSPASTEHHAFLWKNGTMIDLGTVDGDASSTAYSVNHRDQVVGDGSGGHGWLWQNGSMRDLNTLIAPGGALSVVSAAYINNRGEIYGTAVLPNGDQHVVLLIPTSSR